MPQALRVTLPLPPTANNGYIQIPGRGRVASQRLRQWKKDAGWTLQSQPRKTFVGPFRIAIYIPEKARGDVDGYTKFCVDLIVAHKITPDDRFAKSVFAERCEDVSPGECLIVVEQA